MKISASSNTTGKVPREGETAVKGMESVEVAGMASTKMINIEAAGKSVAGRGVRAATVTVAIAIANTLESAGTIENDGTALVLRVVALGVQTTEATRSAGWMAQSEIGRLSPAQSPTQAQSPRHPGMRKSQASGIKARQLRLSRRLPSHGHDQVLPRGAAVASIHQSLRLRHLPDPAVAAAVERSLATSRFTSLVARGQRNQARALRKQARAVEQHPRARARQL